MRTRLNYNQRGSATNGTDCVNSSNHNETLVLRLLVLTRSVYKLLQILLLMVNTKI